MAKFTIKNYWSEVPATIISPLLSMILVVLGTSLFMTIIAVRLNHEGYSNFTLGLITTAFYAGMSWGSIRIEKYVSRIGHIRSFAACCSVTTALILFLSLPLNPLLWILARFIAGFATAGIYVIIESWLLSQSTIQNRGQILAIYMTLFYLASGGSQYLLKLTNPSTLTPFCITALFAALAILPVSITKYPSPALPEPSYLNFFELYKISPLGIATSFVSGLLLGAFYGLGPLFAAETSLTMSQIGQFMGATILGGMFLQYPIGRASDLLGRRKIILFVSLVSALSSLCIAFFVHSSFSFLLFLSLIYGGAVFTLYPLGIAHGTDYLEPKDFVAASGGLSLAYGLGAIVGPLLAPIVMSFLGPRGLYYYMTFASILLLAFGIWRTNQRPSIPIETQGEYIGVPNTSPIANELNPRVEDNEK